TGRPDTLEFSKRPFPLGIWHSPHARMESFTVAPILRPCATISGIGGWSLGYQSAGPNGSLICDRRNVLSVPGSLYIVLSSEAGGAAGVPGGGGVDIPYAHAGCPGGVGGAYCAPSTAMAAKGITASSPKPRNLRIHQPSSRS